MTTPKPKKTRATKANAGMPGTGPEPNPLSPRRVELTQRLHALARDPDKVKEFEKVRDELNALPLDA